MNIIQYLTWNRISNLLMFLYGKWIAIGTMYIAVQIIHNKVTKNTQYLAYGIGTGLFLLFIKSMYYLINDYNVSKFIVTLAYLSFSIVIILIGFRKDFINYADQNNIRIGIILFTIAVLIDFGDNINLAIEGDF